MGRKDVSVSSCGAQPSSADARATFPVIPGSAKLFPGSAGSHSRLAQLPEFAYNGLIYLDFSRPNRVSAGQIEKIPG
jgi:hypothetical protein